MFDDWKYDVIRLQPMSIMKGVSNYSSEMLGFNEF